jgi:hypothetical protein
MRVVTWPAKKIGKKDEDKGRKRECRKKMRMREENGKEGRGRRCGKKIVLKEEEEEA